MQKRNEPPPSEARLKTRKLTKAVHQVMFKYEMKRIGQMNRCPSFKDFIDSQIKNK